MYAIVRRVCVVMVHVSPAQLSGDCFSATEPYLSDTFDVNRKIIPFGENLRGNPYKQRRMLQSCLLFVAPGIASSASLEIDAGMDRKLLDKQGICHARHLPAHENGREGQKVSSTCSLWERLF